MINETIFLSVGQRRDKLSIIISANFDASLGNDLKNQLGFVLNAIWWTRRSPALMTQETLKYKRHVLLRLSYRPMFWIIGEYFKQMGNLISWPRPRPAAPEIVHQSFIVTGDDRTLLFFMVKIKINICAREENVMIITSAVAMLHHSLHHLFFISM